MAASDGSEYFEIGSFGSESFARASNADMVREDEEELQWVALSRLPSQKRINYALLRASSSRPQPPTQGTGTGTENLMDVRKLSRSSREQVVKKALATNDQDNYRLLAAIKERFDRFGFQIIFTFASFQSYRSIILYCYFCFLLLFFFFFFFFLLRQGWIEGAEDRSEVQELERHCGCSNRIQSSSYPD